MRNESKRSRTSSNDRRSLGLWFSTSEDEYGQQRIRLQMELEQLTPVSHNELEQAADLLANFDKHWERLTGNDEAQHDLVKPSWNASTSKTNQWWQ